MLRSSLIKLVVQALGHIEAMVKDHSALAQYQLTKLAFAEFGRAAGHQAGFKFACLGASQAQFVGTGKADMCIKA